jgi:hypothetical protein
MAGVDPGYAHQLVDHAVGDRHLPRLPARPQHDEAVLGGEHVLDPPGLADPRVALHDHDPGDPSTDRRDLGPQYLDLDRSSDERAEVLGDGHARTCLRARDRQ